MLKRCGRRFAVHRFSVKSVVLLCNTVAVVAFATWTSCPAADIVDQSRENQLRSAYLLNFVKFVEWPSIPASGPLSLCFLGGSGVRAAFDSNNSGRSVANHPLITREVKSRTDASGCSMIYIDANVPGWGDYSSSATSQEALTVGDTPDFLARGGIIEMFTKENRLRFNISLFNARKANLRIGSDLLQLAVRVEESAR